MPLLKLENLNLHYGEQIIFDELNLQLDPGNRLCIIGRNGVGKSTLLKVMEGLTETDDGSKFVDSGVRIASLSQELPPAEDICVRDFVAQGLGSLVDDLALFNELALVGDEKSLNKMADLQQKIEQVDGWNVDARIAKTLTKLDLNPEDKLKQLSGGWRRRVSLAQALVINPDVLLLDEPTNHLDVGAIQWLEEQLLQFSGAIVFITHDRAFLRRVANKIGELDRGKLILWDGNYDGFLRFREERLATEEKHNALFDKRLAQEEVWIRQGIKARRTRNEGRVRALKALREERAKRIDVLKTANIQHTSDVPSGKLVAELENISFTYPNESQPIIKNFSAMIARGDKVGLIGPNGYGKSTLLKIILGDLQPSEGSVRLGTKISVAYFDQLRDQLDMNKSAMDNIAEGRDFIDINGRSRHIISYLEDFLFSGERARTVISTLSGGERNRILLAKLFSKPCNVLVMDEPTNDLDVETLELLEDLLVKYDGTLLLVSHDREFLDNVVADSIVFEGDGSVKEYVGGYSDWIRQGGVWPEDKNSDLLTKKQGQKIETPNKQEEKPKAKKLSYKLQKELDELPLKIEKLEAEITELEAMMAEPSFYQQEQDKTQIVIAALSEKQEALTALYERWEDLS